jgi:hypothetical protein
MKTKSGSKVQRKYASANLHRFAALPIFPLLTFLIMPLDTGQIRYSTGGQAYDLQTGGLIVLGASIAHEVESLDESAFLLTISGPGNQRRPASAP